MVVIEREHINQHVEQRYQKRFEESARLICWGAWFLIGTAKFDSSTKNEHRKKGVSNAHHLDPIRSAHAIPLGILTWISSHVDVDFLLDTASGILEEEGISLTHTGEATLFTGTFHPPFLVSCHLIIPGHHKRISPEQQISLEVSADHQSLFVWRSRSAEISATRLTVDKIEISDFSSPSRYARASFSQI